MSKILEQFGDEEALEFEENHRFQVPKGAHWNDVREVSENVGVAIVSAFRKIEKANADKLQGILEMLHGQIRTVCQTDF